MGRYSIGKTDDFVIGDLSKREIAGKTLCVARLECGDILAIDDRCTHEDESLSEGFLDGDSVECPAHGSRFCLRNGVVSGVPAYEDTRAYRVTVEDDNVFVEL